MYKFIYLQLLMISWRANNANVELNSRRLKGNEKHVYGDRAFTNQNNSCAIVEMFFWGGTLERY